MTRTSRSEGIRMLSRAMRRQAVAAGDEDLIALSNRFVFDDVRNAGQFQLAGGTTGFTIEVDLTAELELDIAGTKDDDPDDEAVVDVERVEALLDEPIDTEMKQHIKVAAEAKVSLGQSVDWHSVLALTTLPPELRPVGRSAQPVEMSWITGEPVVLSSLTGVSTTTRFSASAKATASVSMSFLGAGATTGIGVGVSGELVQAWRYRLVDTAPQAFGLDDRSGLTKAVDGILNDHLKSTVAHWLIVNGEIPQGQSNLFGKIAARVIVDFRKSIAKRTGGHPVDRIPDITHSTKGLLDDLDRLEKRLQRERDERVPLADPAAETREKRRIERRLAELDSLRISLQLAKQAKERAKREKAMGASSSTVLEDISEHGHNFISITTFLAKAEANAEHELELVVPKIPQDPGELGIDDLVDGEENDDDENEDDEKEDDDEGEQFEGEIEEAPDDEEPPIKLEAEGSNKIKLSGTTSTELSSRTTRSRIQWMTAPVGPHGRRLVSTIDTEIVNLVIPAVFDRGIGGLSYRSVSAIWMRDRDATSVANAKVPLVPGYSGVATGISVDVDELVHCVAHPGGSTVAELAAKLEMHSPRLLRAFFRNLRTFDWEGDEPGSYVRAVAGGALESTETMLLLEVHAAFGSKPRVEVPLQAATGDRPARPVNLLPQFFGAKSVQQRTSEIQSIRLRARLTDTNETQLGGRVTLGPLVPGLGAKVQVHSAVRCIQMFSACDTYFRHGKVVDSSDAIARMPRMSPVPFVVA